MKIKFCVRKGIKRNRTEKGIQTKKEQLLSQKHGLHEMKPTIEEARVLFY